MPNKRYTCRVHGGVFSMPPRRGRPPVECTPEHKCTEYRPASKRSSNTYSAAVKRAASRTETVSRPERVASAIKNRSQEPAQEPDPREGSVTKGLEAKALLEPLGWEVRGTPYNGNGVRVHAVRGDERLVIVIEDGKVTAQDYSLWPVKVEDTGKPASKLPFNPDEASDREVVAHLSGMKVQWWNQLRQGEETAIVGTGKVKIEHLFNGNGEEPPGSRIVSFIDHGGGGFRSFRLSALIKVG
jgi:hypothetical protein